jgi:WD40 repeat protein
LNFNRYARVIIDVLKEATRAAVAHQGWDYRWQSVPTSSCRRTRKIDGDTSVMTYRGHLVLHTLIRAHFSPEHTTGQRYIYTGCARGNCIVYDLLTGKIERKFEGHRGVVRAVAWHPYENEIATCSWDGVAATWRYDERAERNINPEKPLSVVEANGDEDSCDQEYRPINAGHMRQRRRRRRISSNDESTTADDAYRRRHDAHQQQQPTGLLMRLRSRMRNAAASTTPDSSDDECA